MIHPSLHDWQQAKKSTFLIAATIPNCEVLQLPDGKTKRIILGKRVVDCATWFACYSFLHRIKLDMIGHNPALPPGTIPVAKVAPPEKPPPAQQAKPPPMRAIHAHPGQQRPDIHRGRM